jgi:hypothetical protein
MLMGRKFATKTDCKQVAIASYQGVGTFQAPLKEARGPIHRLFCQAVLLLLLLLIEL